MNDAFVDHPEVVAHEFMHGILHYLNPQLGTSGDGKAIEEALCDIVGVTLKRHHYRDDNWSVGGLRDLSIPFTADELSDLDQIHHNSLLVSHAFYHASRAYQAYDPEDRQLLDIWVQAAQQTAALIGQSFEDFAKKTIELGLEKGGKPLSQIIKKVWRTALLRL